MSVVFVPVNASPFVFSGSLQIDKAQETDEGRYECVAENNVGVVYSFPANVYVRGRTYMIYSLSSYSHHKQVDQKFIIPKTDEIL